MYSQWDVLLWFIMSETASMYTLLEKDMGENEEFPCLYWNSSLMLCSFLTVYSTVNSAQCTMFIHFYNVQHKR